MALNGAPMSSSTTLGRISGNSLSRRSHPSHAVGIVLSRTRAISSFLAEMIAKRVTMMFTFSDSVFKCITIITIENQLKIAEPSLKNDMQHLLYNSMLSDIVFEVENEEIHAHKIILACRCEYFKALCTSTTISSILLGQLQSQEKIVI